MHTKPSEQQQSLAKSFPTRNIYFCFRTCNDQKLLFEKKICYAEVICIIVYFCIDRLSFRDTFRMLIVHTYIQQTVAVLSGKSAGGVILDITDDTNSK